MKKTSIITKDFQKLQTLSTTPILQEVNIGVIQIRTGCPDNQYTNPKK